MSDDSLITENKKSINLINHLYQTQQFAAIVLATKILEYKSLIQYLLKIHLFILGGFLLNKFNFFIIIQLFSYL